MQIILHKRRKFAPSFRVQVNFYPPIDTIMIEEYINAILTIWSAYSLKEESYYEEKRRGNTERECRGRAT